MTSSPDISVAVLADSRGLDTYYLNDRYSESYGIDRVFATRLNNCLRDRFGDGAGSILIPDHFRNGTIETKILRLALNDPSHVLLCDGIWETLLNREKYFEEAAGLGVLDAGVFGTDDEAARQEAGRVLTDLFMAGKLSVSPEGFAEQMNTIAGYFARRRRNTGWLSLIVPPVDHRGGVHYAGNYYPLPGWADCLRAINDAARTVLHRWGGCYVDLDPLVAAAGGIDMALLDQWHFSAAFHDRVAQSLAESVCGDWSVPESVRDKAHVSHQAIVPGRTGSAALCLYDPDGKGPAGMPAVSDAELADLENTAIVVTGQDREVVACDLLKRTDLSNIVLYLEELPASLADSLKAN